MPSTERRKGRPPLSDELLKERREAILRAILKLVAERGTSNVHLRDVASASRVSVGTLQYYFGSRDQALRDAFAQHARQVVATLEEAAAEGGSPWQQIGYLFQTVTRSPQYMERCALWVEFAASSLRDPELRTLMKQAYDGWRKPLLAAVLEGTQTGLFRPVLPPHTVVSDILALIDGYEMALVLETPGVTIEQVRQQLHDTSAALLGLPPKTGNGESARPGSTTGRS